MSQSIELTDYHRARKITFVLDKIEVFYADDNSTVIRMVSGKEYRVEEGVDVVSEIVEER